MISRCLWMSGIVLLLCGSFLSNTSKAVERPAVSAKNATRLKVNANEVTAVRISPKAGRGLTDQVIDELRHTGPWSDSLRNIVPDQQTDVRTRFKVGYDPGGLYFLVVCEEPKIQSIMAKASQDGYDVFADDRIEIFLAPVLGSNPLYQFAVNSQDRRIVCRTDVGPLPEPIWQTRSVCGESSWEVAVFIPWQVFEIEEATGNIWGLNVCRSRCTEGVTNMAWSPTFCNSFFMAEDRHGRLAGLNVDFGRLKPCGNFKPVDFSMRRQDKHYEFIYQVDYFPTDSLRTEFKLDTSRLQFLSAELVSITSNPDNASQRLVVQASVPKSVLQEFDGYGLETMELQAQSALGRSARMNLRRTVPFTYIGDLPDPKHPFIFIDPSRATTLRKRAQVDPWTRGAMQQIIARADQLVAEPMELPAATDGIRTDYYECPDNLCPDCGVMLQWRRHSPREHLCPTCGTVYEGECYDARWWSRYRRFLIPYVRDTGIAYLVTGDEAYARAVRHALLQYVRRYEDFPLYGPGPGCVTGARITSGTISESVHFLLPLLMAYDFTASSESYGPADHEGIREFAGQVVKVVRRFNPGKMNWQVLNNIGVVAASLLLQDRWALDEMVNGLVGFHYHMADSVLPDGFWFEGTLGYHGLVTRIFLEEALMLKRSGVDVWKTKRLRRMVDFVMYLSDAYGVLPVPGDTAPSRLSDDDPVTMVTRAQALWDDYPADIEQGENYQESDSSLFRTEGSAEVCRLLYGPIGSRCPGHRKKHSVDLPDAKMCILGGKNTQLFTRYGQASGGHAHSDAMTVAFNYQGHRLLVDSSTIRYGHPAYREYYIQTLAHNALLVDASTIAAVPANRTLFVDEGPVLLFETQSDRLYPGVEHRRCTLLIDDRFMVDWYKVDSGRQHTFDYVLHLPMGRLQPEDAGPMRAIELTEGGAYRFLQNVTQAPRPGPGRFQYHPKAGPAALVTIRSNPLGVSHLASAPGVNSLTDRTPMLFYRTSGDRARFLAATIPDPDSKAGKWQIRYLDQANACPPGWLGVQISDGGTTHLIFACEANEVLKWRDIECRSDIVYLRCNAQGKTEMLFLVRPLELAFAGRPLALPSSDCIEIRQPGSQAPEMIAH